jgi:hypothetical protein
LFYLVFHGRGAYINSYNAATDMFWLALNAEDSGSTDKRSNELLLLLLL